MNIPNGYKLVPVEPTAEMNKEGMRWMTGFQHMRSNDKRNALSESFKAMLTAAPAPPQPIYDEAKERELFEAHYRKEFEENSGNELSDADIQSMRDGPWYGESRHYLNGQWAGWKQCAKHRAKAGEVGHE